jgi:pimeloyl-ACP methyl ester carboxylesterase
MSTPLLCVAASRDQVVPIEHARRLYEAWAAPKRWLELAATHNTTDGHPELWTAIQSFIDGR